jgi:hypothetical protein
MAIEWMRMVRIQKQNIERLIINATFYAIVASDSAESSSLLSCLSSAQLAVVLPLVLRHLSFLSRHRLPPSGASTCPPLVMPPPLILSLFFSGAVASCLPWLVVVSPLVMPLPSVHLCLCLSLHHCHSLRPSHAIAYQHIVHKRNKNLADELINNTQGICMTRTAI